MTLIFLSSRDTLIERVVNDGLHTDFIIFDSCAHMKRKIEAK